MKKLIDTLTSLGVYYKLINTNFISFQCKDRLIEIYNSKQAIEYDCYITLVGNSYLYEKNINYDKLIQFILFEMKMSRGELKILIIEEILKKL